MEKNVKFLNIYPMYIANTFIKRFKKDDYEISPMKLQKMIYLFYSHALKKGYKLFDELFKTWRYGPVLESVYYEFKPYGYHNIQNMSKDAEGKSYIVNFDYDVDEIFEQVYRVYRNMDAIDLSLFTHQEGMAWREAIKKNQRFLDDEDILKDSYERKC